MKGFLALTVAAACGPAFAGLETPDLSGAVNQSGISVISGYDCTATRIFVMIDDFAPLEAALGTQRNDTIAACGRANTGFSLLYNYNVLAAGPHRMNVYSDKAPIASGSFTVQDYGVEFLRGAHAGMKLRNFPRPGIQSEIVWDENLQNFRIASVTIGPTETALYSGTYFGALHFGVTNAFVCGPVPPTNPPPLAATVKATVDADSISLTAALGDGRNCHASGSRAGFEFAHSGAFEATVTSSDCRELDRVYVALDGDQLTSNDYNGGGCANAQLRAVK